MANKGEIIFKCKYCRANTRHLIQQEDVEYNGKKGMVLLCYVCEHKKFVYRHPKSGALVIDDRDVPERKIILPYDIEHRLGQVELKEEADAHKEVDKWLDWETLNNPKYKGKGFGDGPNKKKDGKK